MRNAAHLITGITGELADRDASPLRLVAAAHPAAALGGPRRTGRAGHRRARAAGPRALRGPGRLDGNGNGDLGSALRCAQIETAATRAGGGTRGGGRVRLLAGCGIVPDSEPDSEVAGTEAEPQPVREALEGR
ncbi:chorismate-binding protein [Saccharopolyspora rectivirgula]|uniref:Chorismate-utilising enzyme C-terminal domain-containing protein n=1 Tax=Saccharopolyspora rectivirgula TaxID=28042 RepID=A0A073BBZ0_9PSEU|nr:chorismate-binding protein [Saccharopolyspora rectivirgula]KEI45284.1 hypothetical protein GU90_05760 [Saccharopolyspora rectivirgula]